MKKSQNDTTVNDLNSRISKLAGQIKKSPEDSFLKFALALELLKNGDQKKALGLFKNIQQSDPDYVGVYYHLGKLYEELGENKFALKSYKKGIEIAQQKKDLHAKSELQGALMNLEFEMDE